MAVAQSKEAIGVIDEALQATAMAGNEDDAREDWLSKLQALREEELL